MRVLVTGAGGFLGRYLVEQLVARGDRVRCVSRGSYPALESMCVETVQGDLRDADLAMVVCHGMDVVFHAAAVAGIWGSWDHYYSINTLATKNIVAGCLRHRVRKLVYTSSPSVTFDGSDQNGVDESVPYASRWLCHYPHTKALAEQHVLASSGQQGLVTCALRPHLIWGPRDSHLIPRLLNRARQGKLRRVGDGKNLVDMIYVENAAAAHLQAADALEEGSKVCGRAYFISQGEPVNCWNWINEILGLAGLPPVRKSLSFRTAWRIGATMETAYRTMGWTSEPRMTRFLASQLAKSHYFDIQRARNDFGYLPQISTAEGMKRLAAELSPTGL
ncbi:MAG: NAD-dependent epimerase/dehydratase family protein [Pirellulaceae bacterium]|nr:NAD-dependent epimerase/dehydratase family protein [Pirellulaceae bacterium]